MVWNTKYHVKANALHLLYIIREGEGVGIHKACAPLGLERDMVGVRAKAGMIMSIMYVIRTFHFQ